MKKSDIIEAVRKAKADAGNARDVAQVECGDGWQVVVQREYQRRAKFAWYWVLYAIRPDGQKVGGTRYQDSLAEMILQAQRAA